MQVQALANGPPRIIKGATCAQLCKFRANFDARCQTTVQCHKQNDQLKKTSEVFATRGGRLDGSQSVVLAWGNDRCFGFAWVALMLKQMPAVKENHDTLTSLYFTLFTVARPIPYRGMHLNMIPLISTRFPSYPADDGDDATRPGQAVPFSSSSTPHQSLPGIAYYYEWEVSVADTVGHSQELALNAGARASNNHIQASFKGFFSANALPTRQTGRQPLSSGAVSRAPYISNRRGMST